MIKVTVGEQKTQSEKPFPKLMIRGSGQIIFATGIRDEDGHYEVLKIKGFERLDGSISSSFKLFEGVEKFTDYNEPITLQNA